MWCSLYQPMKVTIDLTKLAGTLTTLSAWGCVLLVLILPVFSNQFFAAVVAAFFLFWLSGKLPESSD